MTKGRPYKETAVKFLVLVIWTLLFVRVFLIWNGWVQWSVFPVTWWGSGNLVKSVVLQMVQDLAVQENVSLANEFQVFQLAEREGFEDPLGNRSVRSVNGKNQL